MNEPTHSTNQLATVQEEEQKAKEEHQEAKERSAPSSKIIHDAILKEGQEELGRSSDALFWSGLAAGLSMGPSMIAEGVMTHYLPDSPWRPLVAGLQPGIPSCGVWAAVAVHRKYAHPDTTAAVRTHLAQNVVRAAAVGRGAGSQLGCLALVLALSVAHTDAFEPAIRAGFAHMGQVLGGFTVPALLGNILGGVLLVAGLNHA